MKLSEYIYRNTISSESMMNERSFVVLNMWYEVLKGFEEFGIYGGALLYCVGMNREGIVVYGTVNAQGRQVEFSRWYCDEMSRQGCLVRHVGVGKVYDASSEWDEGGLRWYRSN